MELLTEKGVGGSHKQTQNLKMLLFFFYLGGDNSCQYLLYQQ